jgi:hypothetical protein
MIDDNTEQYGVNKRMGIKSMIMIILFPVMGDRYQKILDMATSFLL